MMLFEDWGTTLLEYIGSQEAFKSLIDFLKDEDASKKKSYLETRLFAVRVIEKMAQKKTYSSKRRNGEPYYDAELEKLFVI